MSIVFLSSLRYNFSYIITKGTETEDLTKITGVLQKPGKHFAIRHYNSIYVWLSVLMRNGFVKQ